MAKLPANLSKLLGSKVDKLTPGDTTDKLKKKKPVRGSSIPGLSRLLGGK